MLIIIIFEKKYNTKMINMFKPSNSLICFSAIIVMLLASCSSPENSMSIIPSETSYVSVVDVYSLLKKGEIEKLKESRLFKDAEDELRNESIRVSDLMREAMDNPSSTGIDFTSSLVSFGMNKYKGEHFNCVTMGLSSKENFKKFASEILDEAKVDYRIEDKENHSYIELVGDGALAWDDSKMIFVAPTDYNSRENIAYQTKKLFGLKSKDQLISNGSFNSFLGNKQDISIWVSSNILPGIVGKSAYAEMEKEAKVELKDNTLLSYISFNEGEIVVNTSLEMSEELKALYADKGSFNSKFNEELLTVLPKEHLFVTSLSMNVEKVIEAIQEDENYDEIEAELSRELRRSGTDLGDIFRKIESFKGSFIFSVFDVKEVVLEPRGYQNRYYEEMGQTAPVRTEMMPQMAVVFDIEEGSLLNEFRNEMRRFEKNGYYEMTEAGMKWYAGYNNSMGFVTNNLEKMEDFMSSRISENTLANSDITSSILDNEVMINANLDYDNYPFELRKKIEKSQNSYERKIFDNWKSVAKEVQIINKNDSNLELIVKLNDKDRNSLSTILDLVVKSN